MRAIKHILDNIDGKKRMPLWLHRAHRLGHLIYYGAMAFGLASIHDRIVLVVFALEGLSLVLGREELRNAVIEFE